MLSAAVERKALGSCKPPCTVMPPCCHSNARCGCQRSVWWQPPPCPPHTLYTDSPASQGGSLSRTPRRTLRAQTDRNATWSSDNNPASVDNTLNSGGWGLCDSEQYLGLGHRGSCYSSPGSVWVCGAATSPPGCTCCRDTSDGLEGSPWICSCWSVWPLPHRPLKAKLRTEKAVAWEMRHHLISYTWCSISPSASKCADPLAGTHCFPASQRKKKQWK